MTDVQRLIEEATPLPWTFDGDWWTGGDGSDVGLYHDSNAPLILYAVNRLPAYEAAVGALERLVTADDDMAFDLAMDAARAALARLRDDDLTVDR